MKEVLVLEMDLCKVVYQLEESMEKIDSTINLLEPSMLDEDLALLELALNKIDYSVSAIKGFLK
jgi:hypothetical protein